MVWSLCVFFSSWLAGPRYDLNLGLGGFLSSQLAMHPDARGCCKWILSPLIGTLHHYACTWLLQLSSTGDSFSEADACSLLTAPDIGQAKVHSSCLPLLNWECSGSCVDRSSGHYPWSHACCPVTIEPNATDCTVELAEAACFMSSACNVM